MPSLISAARRLTSARFEMRPRVLAMAKRGLSARSIQQQLIGRYGKAYRWTDLLQDVRSAKGRQLKQHLIESLPSYVRPDKGRMIEVRLKQRFKYRVIGQATVQNKFTGDFSQRTVSVYTDQLLSAEEVDDYFIKIQGERSYTQDVDWISFIPKAYEHNEGMSY